ncbi:PP2C family protein-serine/threonine phosphatase [Amycolatopsis thermoflava]|uniref:PP2C family protein-serine/threonine phosphatase n=1 Tax=Amycolatopsis thermoflava TaxID=84480 RepID=UPI003668502C
MSDVPSGLASVLAAAERASPVRSVDVVAAYLAERFAASDTSFLLVDLVGRELVRLDGTALHGADAERVDLAGSVYERVLYSQEPFHDQGRVIVPVTHRGDAIGLLETTVPGPDVLRQVGEVAHALAYLIVTDRRFTDLYEWGERTTQVSLAAEIQHQLLPPAPSCEAPEFTLACALVPADDVGGDTYDYALDHGTLNLSITDAVGHDVQSGLVATLLMGALRGARRANRPLADQAAEADRAVLRHAKIPYATGQLFRVELDGGRAEVVNAGHPLPLLLRDGHVREVPLHRDTPFGTGLQDKPHEVQVVDLRPADRLFLLTDGMLEREAASVDLRRLARETAGLHPRAVVQTLTRAVVDAADGHPKDDACVICLDWMG